MWQWFCCDLSELTMISPFNVQICISWCRRIQEWPCYKAPGLITGDSSGIWSAAMDYTAATHMKQWWLHPLLRTERFTVGLTKLIYICKSTWPINNKLPNSSLKNENGSSWSSDTRAYEVLSSRLNIRLQIFCARAKYWYAMIQIRAFWRITRTTKGLYHVTKAVTRRSIVATVACPCGKALDLQPLW